MTTIRRRAATVLVAACALVACVSPAVASAAGEPQITSAGIDATDHLYVSWTLAAGTTFEEVDFASGSIREQLLDYQTFVDTDNYAGYECIPPPKICAGKPTLTSYRESIRVSRDRRYFVIVTAKTPAGEATSATWVIDEAKPLIPGQGEPSDTPTGILATGAPYVEPAPETVPAPRVELVAPVPETIAGFLRRGIRARLHCPTFECYAFMALEIRGAAPVLQGATARPDGRRTFVLRPTKALRAKLRRRSSISLQLTADVSQPGRKETELVRKLSRLRR